MYIIQCLLYCMNACEGELALAPQLLAICLSLGFCVPNGRGRRWWFLLSISWIPYAFEALHLFYRDRKNPFSSSIVFAQSLTCVFFSLFQVNLKIHLTLHREQTEKVLFEGGNQSLLMLISFPTKNLKEGEVRRDKKKFFPLCSFLADLDCPWGECGLHVW